MFNDDPLWTLIYNEFIPEKEKHTEALCTIGNGYLGCRGAFEESVSSNHHYPGTYIAGLYNRRISKVGDRDIENEDFVNCPDWTFLNFKISGDSWFDILKGEILNYKKQLNLYDGTLLREIRFRHNSGNITKIQSIRCVSMTKAHLAAIQYRLTPENYSEKIYIKSALKGDIKNEGVERYKQLNQLHLQAKSGSIDGSTLFLEVTTAQSNITIVESAKHTLFLNENLISPIYTSANYDRYVEIDFEVDAEQGDTVSCEKIVGIYTSNDAGIDSPSQAVRELLNASGTFRNILEESSAKWHSIWEEIDIELNGDDRTQQILRVHAYNMMVCASFFNAEIDAAIPARGLHGEAYRGHVFWDEMFMFPFFNVHFPDISKSLLMYRYRRLNAARAYAKEYGYCGAMFPWQSGSDGREETQIVHLNPKSGKWGDDYSSLQRHISLAVAYNFWVYFKTTGDSDFYQDFGAEVLLDITKFWVSKCKRNPETNRYEIDKVMGPNEFHEMVPGATEGGIKDNAYTNILVAWLIGCAQETLEIVDENTRRRLRDTLSIQEGDIEKWDDVARNLNIIVKNDIISQYDGFLDLDELDWDHYRKKYGSIGRMDRILKAEGKSPDDYQLGKQADLIMTFFVLPLPIVESVLSQMGYTFNRDLLRKNYDYYIKRTSHGSTLSLIVHSYVAALLGDMETSIDWYDKSLDADIHDIQGGTTQEGIHAGLMGGTLNQLLTAYVGLDLWKDHVVINPRLPKKWRSCAFKFQFRGTKYTVTITQEAITVCVVSGEAEKNAIEINNHMYTLTIGNKLTVQLT